MDWHMVAIAWAPVMPLVLILLKAHRDVVYKVIPDQFHRTRRILRHQAEESRLRHQEHINMMKALIHVFDRQSGGKKSIQDGPPRPAKTRKRGKSHQKKAPRKRGG